MSHMGEANVAMARRDRPMPLVARPTPITRTRGRQLALVTSFEPGPATLCALTLGPQTTLAADRQPHGDRGFRAAGGPARAARQDRSADRRAAMADRLRRGGRAPSPCRSASAMPGRG